MVSLAQNLAADIVQEIFKPFSTPIIIPVPNSDHEDKDGVKPFPWYLGHVCSSWRAVFFAMYSEFWSTITIHAHRRYPHSAWEEVVSVAKVFLECTQGRPFSFSIDATHPCPPILALFIAESTRWKDVSLYLDDYDENIPLLRSIKNKIPQLRSLTVNIELGMPRDFPLIFEDVPALTHLSLVHLGNWRMNWSLLTDLELSREFNICRLLRVLMQATNLERLGLNRITVNPEEPGERNFEPVTLPRLRTLEISEFGILQFLTTPALQGLYIYKSRNHELLGELCASFFTRSSCQLQRFGTIQFLPKDLVEILPYTPDLEVLTVCDPMGMRSFVEAMTSRTGLVPQLRVLRLRDRRRLDVNWLKEMLESRVSDSVQELKVIVAGSNWRYDKCEFQHPQLRLVEKDEFSFALLSQFQWLCDDLDC